MQRSANAEFSSPTNLPNQYVDTGLTYVAVDPTPAAQGKKNFYRVAILDASGKPTNTSQAAQPLSALGIYLWLSLNIDAFVSCLPPQKYHLHIVCQIST